MKNTAVILANGEFPTRKENLLLLQHAGTVICCDGAAENLHRFGRAPDVIIGDLDSTPTLLKKMYRTRIIRVAEQETNDLAKAFRFTIKQNCRQIIILGATGKREDHTLGNLSLLPDFTEIFPDITLLTDSGSFQAILKKKTLDSKPGQQISIFSFDPEMPVSSRGLKYPLNGLRLKRWWQATLNEAMDKEFTVDFPGPAPLLIFKKFL